MLVHQISTSTPDRGTMLATKSPPRRDNVRGPAPKGLVSMRPQNTSWFAWPPRQLTGQPYRYHGYVTRDCKRAERMCHEGYHRSPEAARACAERAARRLNKAP